MTPSPQQIAQWLGEAQIYETDRLDDTYESTRIIALCQALKASQDVVRTLREAVVQQHVGGDGECVFCGHYVDVGSEPHKPDCLVLACQQALHRAAQEPS